jgi:hypothetical protein
MVRHLRLGANLKDMGLHAASRSQTYRNIAQSVGPEKARAIVIEELVKAEPKYRGRWDSNLASAYAPRFSAEELRSLTEERRQSPHFQKLVAKQNEVSAAMQSKSTGLLNDYVTEAMTNAFRRVAPTK